MAHVQEFEGTDRFEVLSRLGSGSMGVVYHVYDRERDLAVALKTLHEFEPIALYRFKQEFRSLVDVVHPNLVTLHELFSEAGHWFFTMEYVDGTSLTHYLHQCPVGSSRFRNVVRQLAEGVASIHLAGRLHRDLKPSNVLVTKDGRPVILDFGLMTTTEGPDTSFDDQIVGTAWYMSPEQGLGERLNNRSDWYSVGCMLFEALTGRVPFDAENIYRILANKVEATQPPAFTDAHGRPVEDIPEDLAELCRRLLARDPNLRPDANEVLARLGDNLTESTPPAGLPQVAPSAQEILPFLGRERHIARLFTAFEVARMGRAVAVGVTGMSGMGKSALVEAFIDEVTAEHDVLVLRGRCYERESVPYKAFDELIDGVSRHLKSLPSRDAEQLTPRQAGGLLRLFPVLERVESFRRASHNAAPPDPHEAREQAVVALRELFSGLCRRRPVLVFLDDLHWGDADSSRLLVDLLRPPDAPPILLLATYRQGENDAMSLARVLERTRERKGMVADLREIELQPLDLPSSIRLARQLMGDVPDVEAKAATVARESAGNPLFLAELSFHLSEHGTSGLGSVTLEEVFGRRMSEVTPDARALLEVIVLAGRPIRQDVAASAARLGGEYTAAFNQLRNRHLIRTHGARGIHLVEPFHSRVADIVYLALPADRQVIHHGGLADALEAVGTHNSEAMLEHLVGAREYQRAMSCAEQLAEQAAEALAFSQAATFYKQALDLMERAEVERSAVTDLTELTSGPAESVDSEAGAPDAEPATPEFSEAEQHRAQLYEAMAVTLANSGQGQRAADAYLATAELVSGTSATDLRRRAAEEMLRAGVISAGFDLLGDVLRELGLGMPATPRRALAALLLRRGRLKLRGIKYPKNTDSFDPVELARIDACYSGAISLSMVDTLRGAELQTRHLLLAMKLGEPYRLSRALALESTFTVISGPAGQRRAEMLLTKAEAIAEKIQHPHAIGFGQLMRGFSCFQRGEWVEARRYLLTAEETFRSGCANVSWEVSNARIFYFGALYYGGDWRELCSRGPALIEEQAKRGDYYASTNLRSDPLNVIWLVNDDPEMARREIDEVMAEWSEERFLVQHYWRLLAETRVDLYEGDGNRAWERVRRHWPALKKSMLLHIQIVRTWSYQMRGRAALAAALQQKDPLRLVSIAEKAAKQLSKERLPNIEPMAWLIGAGCAVERGDVEKAIRLLRAATERLDEVPMRMFAAAGRRRLGELIGGDEGRRLVTDAVSSMREQGILDPTKITDTLVPGRFKTRDPHQRTNSKSIK